MKIQNEQLQALQNLQQGDTHRKNKVAEGFDSLLNEQITGNNPALAGGLTAHAGQSALTGSLGLLLQSSENLAYGLQENPEEANDMDLASLKIGGLLDKWESYADKLSSSKGGKNGETPDLRSVYSILQNMGDELKGLRAAMPNLAERNSNLNSLVNELEVLTVTEQFKFNRGDYL